MDLILIFIVGFAAGAAVDHFFSIRIESAIQRVEAAVKTLKV